MNKFKLVLFSILGGIEVIFYIATPIIVSVLWVSISGWETWHSYFLYAIGLLATIFRGIKIGWLKDKI